MRLGPSSAQLRELFATVDATANAILVAEGESFIDALELPGPMRLDAKRRLGKGEPVLSYATELIDVRRGSLLVDVLIDPQRLIDAVSVVLVWAAGKTLDRGWGTIRGRASTSLESMFSRSRETVEHSVSNERRRTIAVTEVGGPDPGVIQITAVRVTVANDRDLDRAREILREIRLFE
jgi:hypothetical protein